MTTDFLSTPNNHPQSLPGAPAKVLLVDDQRANLVALRSVLEGLECELVEAATGAEALQQLETHDFAVILQDLHLPDTSGFELARILRERTRNQHTPIIFLTAGDVTRSEAEQAYALDAVDFLTKPFVPLALQAKVRALMKVFLDKQQALREAEQLRLIVQGTNDYAIFMLDPNGFIATWNSGARRLKGYEAAEIIGKHF